MIALALTVLIQGPMAMTITLDGKRLGEASLKQSIQEDKRKVIEMRTEIKGPDGKTLITRVETQYDLSGQPLRKFMEMTRPNERYRRTVIVTFDKAGANVVLEENGKRQTKSVALVPSAPRANEAELWFIRTKPRVGAKIQAYNFNLDTLSWELENIQYSGPKLLKSNGHEVKVHEIRSEKTVVYLDEKGLPYVILYGRIKLERKP